MKNKIIPRILIAGVSSGCGKTTITCALLQALVNRGLKTASFKSGPDYIDPMFHGEIIGVKSSNLDAFFCDESTIRYLLNKNSMDCDISIIEGVMGYYDGINLNSIKASTYEVSKITNTPVILTINCKGMANSVIALIKGFIEYKNDSNIVGVILNNISKSTFEVVKINIENEFNGSLKVLGYLPKLSDDLVFGSRHLGLITAEEINDIKEKLNNLANIIENTVNIDDIIEIANNVSEINYKAPYINHHNNKVRIAVAYDRACCFYYRDNLELLEEMGAELVYFSPINDKELPSDIDGLYIGGGYPELYCEKLSGNISMLNSIKTALINKIPCIAECGGFMYLSKTIDDYRMVGFLEGKSDNTNKLSRFGYITLLANKDNMLCKKGEKIRGHEFHYYDSTECGNSFTAIKENGKTWNCIIATDSLYAGYPHLHFYSNLKFVENFYVKCVEYKKSIDIPTQLKNQENNSLLKLEENR